MHNTTNRLNIDAGVDAIRHGEVVVYPTESVYGFGCDPLQPAAIKKIIHLKKREKNKGFILIVSCFSQLESYVDWHKVAQDKWQAVKNAWPGPVTWVLPAQTHVEPLLLGPNQTIAIRMSAHPVAKSLCAGMKGAIVSTSVNVSAQAPLMQSDDILTGFSDDIAGIVAGDLGREHKPSWVIDFASQVVLRAGSDKKIIKKLGIV
jgi:L-threonylcarbamoyladenylate synthase